jgi:hypothetical protein
MTIQQQVLLRHRSDGHLRFDLPAALAVPAIAERLAADLRGLEGVYRVDLSPRQGKLSIRYREFVCGFAAVVKRLYALIGELMAVRPVENCCAGPAGNPAPPAVPRSLAVVGSAPGGGFADWLRTKLAEIRETFTAAGIVASQALDAVRQRPRWMQEFANDLLMLFLIKLHWHPMTTLWLPHPWTYRYEWLATFYLIYLLVQSKLPAKP